jgi:hypothetical protein
MPWNPQKIDSGRIAIHAALVPTAAQNGAAIVYFDGVFGDPGTRLFNVDTLAVSEVPDSPDAHIMCSGHAFLGDGRLLVGGGVVEQNVPHIGHGQHDSGERRCHIYNPLKGSWEPADDPVADLSFQPGSKSKGGGRWYPTLMTVGSGEVLAVAGHPYAGVCLERDEDGNCISEDTTGADDYVFPDDDFPRHNNNTPERYSPANNKWTLLTAESSSNNNNDIDEYPRLHLGPSGHVFFSTIAKNNKRFYDPYTGEYASTNVDLGDQAYRRGSKATSVLLPLLPNDPDKVWVLVCGGATPRRINIAAQDPEWEGAGNRTIAGNPVRLDVCSVILPTGQVFVTGGVGDNANPEATGVYLPEIYTPAINWSSGQYTNGAGEWREFAEDEIEAESATIARGYHSVALLMPDGRVWTAGSTDNADAQERMTIEIYEPEYFAVGNRRVIESCPRSVGYEQQFKVRVNGGGVLRVAVTRCGSVTHAFDADQRYVALTINQFSHPVDEDFLDLTLTSPAGPGVAPPGNYMLWVIDTNGNPCQRGSFIRICDQLCTPVNNHSTFSLLEAEALLDGGEARFPGALYVYFENYRPGEIGFPNRDPSITLRWDSASGSVISPAKMKVVRTDKWAEDDALEPDVAQRFTFVFEVVFDGLDLFEQVNASRDVHVRVAIDNHVCTTMWKLTTKPNPYMTDIEGGNAHWLSTDLRTFQIQPGQTKFGAEFLASDSPLDFLDTVLDHFNAESNDSSHPFRKIPAGFESNPLEWSRQVGDDRVYNFAIAKVRYVANSTNAENVRVFFRMFNTVGTMLDYNSSTTYRRDVEGSNAIALLGKLGSGIISIPFFGAPRVTPGQSMKAQTDNAVNRHTIEAKGADESVWYFGCWLDINQTEKHIATFPATDGPYFGDNFLDFFNTPVSIQELMRNPHQCLVAEVFFADDPIPDAAKGEPPGTPANNDNLSQRNLVLVKSGNPGSPASRLVQTTFVVKPSRGRTAELVGRRVMPQPNQVLHANRARVAGPDELLIRSKNLPKASVVSLYMPDVDADEVLQLAARRLSPVRLHRVDDHTIRFTVGDVTFIPLPGDRTRPIPGLMSVQLPEGVTKGQLFTVTVEQYSATNRRIIGSFQLTVPVEAEADLLEGETRKLAVMRHIFKAIPREDIWRPIWVRFLKQVEDRVRAFGGDPDKVLPSPDGGGAATPGLPPAPQEVQEGKVSQILYDCFGDFAGFVLETCSGEHVIESCGKRFEELILRACREGSRIAVYMNPAQKHRKIARIAVHCC